MVSSVEDITAHAAQSVKHSSWSDIKAMAAAATLMPMLYFGALRGRNAKVDEINELRKDIEQHRRDIEMCELRSRTASDMAFATPDMKSSAEFIAEHNRRQVLCLDSQIADKLNRIKALNNEIDAENKRREEEIKRQEDESDRLKDEKDGIIHELECRNRNQGKSIGELQDQIKLLQRTVKSLGTKLNNARKRAKAKRTK